MNSEHYIQTKKFEITDLEEINWPLDNPMDILLREKIKVYF